MKRGVLTPVSLKAVIASAKQNLRIATTTEHDLMLYRLADECISQIGTLDGFVKMTRCFDIEDYKFELPEGFIRPIAIRLVGTQTDGVAGNVLYFNQDFLRQCDCEDTQFRNYSDLQATGQISEGYWVFNTDINATQAVMSYYGRNLDEDCMMVMYEQQERAVRSYLCWNFTRIFYDLYPRDVRNEYMAEWTAQRRYLIGETVQRDFRNKREQIGSIVSAIISNHNFSI
jgi:hypothetical protein